MSDIGIGAQTGGGYTTEQLPCVTPLCVFAAGRDAFDVIVRRGEFPNGIKAAIFDELPLERHGWDFRSSRLSIVKNTPDGQPVYHLERGGPAQ